MKIKAYREKKFDSKDIIYISKENQFTTQFSIDEAKSLFLELKEILEEK
jgi:hypothetical protein